MAEEKEVYKSIFDAASKLERKKALDKALTESRDDLSAVEEKAIVMTDEEMNQRFEQCKQLHNLIADRLEEVFVKNNLTPTRLRDYFETPQNFTERQWRLIEQQKSTVKQMLSRLIPHPIEPASVEKSAEEKAKEKRPTKMQVKSRWISMR